MKFLVSCISLGSQFKISGEKDKKVQTRTDGDPTDDLPIKVTVEAGDSTCLFLKRPHLRKNKRNNCYFSWNRFLILCTIEQKRGS